MHFNNHAFSKNEKNHAQIKTKLQTFIKNLNDVINDFDKTCDRHRKNYIHNIDQIKQQLNHHIRKIAIFRDFLIFVIFFVLKKFFIHYKRLMKTQKK